jgi:hypothetical protein
MAVGDSNPSAEGSWTDGSGVVWRRKGTRGYRLPERRVRSLLRRAGVPLVVWQSFETEQHVDPASKVVAADALYGLADRPGDVVAHEWESDDGRRLLMLEHLC